MTTWIALLRGINVGGKNKLPMADLRSLASDLGWGDARTYIQSGNLVFRSDERVHSELASTLGAAIHARFGLAVPVIVRTLAELVQAQATNPFVAQAQDPKTVHVLLLDGPSDATLDPDRSPADKMVLIHDRIYVHYTNGSRNSKLTLAWFERQTGRRGTARNWRTLGKIVDLAGRHEAGG